MWLCCLPACLPASVPPRQPPGRPPIGSEYLFLCILVAFAVSVCSCPVPVITVLSCYSPEVPSKQTARPATAACLRQRGRGWTLHASAWPPAACLPEVGLQLAWCVQHTSKHHSRRSLHYMIQMQMPWQGSVQLKSPLTQHSTSSCALTQQGLQLCHDGQHHVQLHIAKGLHAA